MSALALPILARIGLTLLHFLWQGAVVAAGLALALRLMRRQTAAARYAAACGAMAILAAAPIVTFTQVPLQSPAISAVYEGTTDAVATLEEMPAPAQSASPAPEGIAAPVADTARAGTIRSPYLAGLALLWLVGVCALSLRLLGGWVQCQRYRRVLVQPAPPTWQERANQLLAQLGSRVAVQVLESGLVQVPMLIGWLRPVVLMPVSVMTGLDAEQLDGILAHELAHVRRHDYLINLLQTVLETLLFFHPAVWWVSHRIRVEREFCCDDLATALTGDVLTYAQALAELEETRHRALDPVLAATGGVLFDRVARLLTPRPARSEGSWLPSATVAMSMVAFICATLLPLPAIARSNGDFTFVERMLNTSVSSVASVPGEELSGATRASSTSPVGVAFTQIDPSNLGRGVGELRTLLERAVPVHLTAASGLRLVDRSALSKVLDEQRMGQAGLVQASTASEVGRLTGARIALDGAIQRLNDETTVLFTMVDTQSGEMAVLPVTQNADEPDSDFASRAAQAAANRVEQFAAERNQDEIGVKPLMTGPLPSLAVYIPETHLGAQPPDPAGENELISGLLRLGFPVRSVVPTVPVDEPLNEERLLAAAAGKADILILGEAFSEPNGEAYGFQSCGARIEVKAIDVSRGTIATADSHQAAGAALGEMSAAKKALRTAAAELTPNLGRAIAEYWQHRTETP